MDTLFPINKRKALVAFAIPIGFSVALVAWTVTSAYAKLSTLEGNAVRHAAAVHQLNTITTLIVLFLVVGVFVPMALVYRRLVSTKIQEAGIIQRGLFTTSQLKWSEIVRVRRTKKGFRLYGHSGTAVIAPGFFHQSAAVVAYVEGRLASTLTSRGEAVP